MCCKQIFAQSSKIGIQSPYFFLVLLKCDPYNNTLEMSMANNTVVNVILHFSWLLVGGCSAAHGGLGIRKVCNLLAFFQASTAATELCTQNNFGLHNFQPFHSIPSYFKPFPLTHKPFPVNYNSSNNFQHCTALSKHVQLFPGIYIFFQSFLWKSVKFRKYMISDYLNFKSGRNFLAHSDMISFALQLKPLYNKATQLRK